MILQLEMSEITLKRKYKSINDLDIKASLSLGRGKGEEGK